MIDEFNGLDFLNQNFNTIETLKTPKIKKIDSFHKINSFEGQTEKINNLNIEIGKNYEIKSLIPKGLTKSISKVPTRNLNKTLLEFQHESKLQKVQSTNKNNSLSLIKNREKVIIDERNRVDSNNKQLNTRNNKQTEINNSVKIKNYSFGQNKNNYLDKIQFDNESAMLRPAMSSFHTINNHDDPYVIICNIFSNKILSYNESLKKETIMDDLIECFDSLKIYNYKFKKISTELKLLNEKEHNNIEKTKKEVIELNHQNLELKKDFYILKKKSEDKENLNKKQQDLINFLKNSITVKDELIQNLYNKHSYSISNIEIYFSTLKTEISCYQKRISELEKTIESYNKNEKKFMKIINLIYKKGKHFEEILCSKNRTELLLNELNKIDNSQLTLDFPDKSGNAEQYKELIPFLEQACLIDFDRLPFESLNHNRDKTLENEKFYSKREFNDIDENKISQINISKY